MRSILRNVEWLLLPEPEEGDRDSGRAVFSFLFFVMGCLHVVGGALVLSGLSVKNSDGILPFAMWPIYFAFYAVGLFYFTLTVHHAVPSHSSRAVLSLLVALVLSGVAVVSLVAAYLIVGVGRPWVAAATALTTAVAYLCSTRLRNRARRERR